MQEMDGVMAKQFGLEKPQGVLVGDVTPGGPAEQAGVEPGDVILRYASQEIADMNALRLMVVETRPGEEVVIELIRGSQTLELTVTIGLLPEQGYSGLNRYVAPKPPKPELETLDKLPGVELGPCDASTRQRYQIADSVEGLVILSVDTSGFAYEQGLREGQVIMDINREPVRNLSDLAEFQKLKPGESWLLRLWSEGGARFLVLEHP
jgi:serine protease Do